MLESNMNQVRQSKCLAMKNCKWSNKSYNIYVHCIPFYNLISNLDFDEHLDER